MDLPMPYDVSYDEATCDHIDYPEDGSNDGCSVTLSIIIRYAVTHRSTPDIPTSEEASADLT